MSKLHPDLLTGILVFDIYIANCDRNKGNIKVDNPNIPKRIYVFDHDRSLFYVMPGEGVDRLESRIGRLGITDTFESASSETTHCLIEVVDSLEYFPKWVKRIGDIPDWFIKETCEAVQGIGTTRKEIAKVTKFLKQRRRSIGNLIVENRHRFVGIRDNWPLILA